MPALINSDDGVVSGSSGLKTTGANDGILALQNNGTTNVTVTAAGRVGVGITAPVGKFQIQGPAAQGRFFTDDNVLNYTIDSNDDVTRGKSLYFRYCGDGANRALVFTDGTLAFQTGAGGLSAALPGGSTQYPAFFARAWVNFNGTGTVAIRASGNVSSITDNGTGDYTVNFTTSMPDTNYNMVATVSGAGTGQLIGVDAGGGPTVNTGSIRSIFGRTGSSPFSILDCSYVQVTIFR